MGCNTTIPPRRPASPRCQNACCCGSPACPGFSPARPGRTSCCWWQAPSWRRASEPSPRHCGLLGREQENDFPIYHGVLNKAVWSSRAVAGWLLRLLVATFLGADATVVIGIDDTIERRWGRKISARGIYRDPVRSSKGHFVKTSGLRWLSAQLLVHIPWAGRIMGLPFLTMLAPSKRFYADTPRSPKTLLDWARQAAFQIHRWLPDRKHRHCRRHRVCRHRLPRRRPNLCQCRHPIAPRRQSLCARTAQTTRPRTTGGQGQAPAHADPGATPCRHKLAAPHCHPLVRPHQSHR